MGRIRLEGNRCPQIGSFPVVIRSRALKVFTIKDGQGSCSFLLLNIHLIRSLAFQTPPHLDHIALFPSPQRRSGMLSCALLSVVSAFLLASAAVLAAPAATWQPKYTYTSEGGTTVSKETVSYASVRTPTA